MNRILLLIFMMSYHISSSQTNCSSFPLPFTEGFETTSTSLTCWAMLNSNGDAQMWSTNTNNTYSGTQNKAILLHNLAQFGTANDWLISPEINLGTDNVVKQLKFYIKLSPLQHVGWRVAQKLRVMVAPSGGGGVINNNSFTIEVMPNRYFGNDYYQMVLVDLDTPTGDAIQGNVHIGFHVLETSNPVGRGMYIDDVSVYAKSTCPQPTDVDACPDETVAYAFWDSPASVTEWEYSVVYAGSEPQFPGILTNTPNVELTGLLPNTNYVIYVRSKCGTEYSSYVPYYFKTIPSVVEANPFCGDSGSIVFANNYGQPNTSGYGPIGCLSFSPNPIWYYFEISQPGDLEFNILQNTSFDGNGNPTGVNLDVDYVAFGPFNDLQEACDLIDVEYCLDCPSYQQVNAPGTVPANAYPNGLIVDCSPSPSYIEALSIPNAQQGQIYAVLISNWDGVQGFIKLEQTNIGEEGAGSTNCDFMCTVDLGNDVVVCDANTFTIDAEINTVGSGDVVSIEWYKDNVLMDPLVYNTLTINVNTHGVYRIEVVKEQCEEEVIVDEIWVRFVDSFLQQDIPNEFIFCDISNDGVETFPHTRFLNSFMSNAQQQDYVVTYHLSQVEANAQLNAIDYTTYQISSDIILYVRISHVLNSNCATIKAVDFKLNEMFVPFIEFTYETPICGTSLGTVYPELPINFTTGGVFSSSASLNINAQTGAINLNSSQNGVHQITYKIQEDLENCIEAAQYTFTFELFPDVNIIIQPACNQNSFVLSMIDINQNIDLSGVSYQWSGPNSFTSNTPEIIINELGEYRLKITTKDGCVVEEIIDITDTSCFIQKGISPNGDGLNDKFEIDNYIVSSLKIFNRHGGEVYKFEGFYKDEWHGQDQSGNALPDGTYFYELLTHKGPITGWIHINK